MDAQQWRGRGTRVVWGIGRPPRLPTSIMTISGTIARGTYGSYTVPRVQYSQRCSDPIVTPLKVDGVSLVILQIRCDITWTTTAWSTEPAIYVQGEGHTAKAAELILSVMRTIRFTSPQP